MRLGMYTAAEYEKLRSTGALVPIGMAVCERADGSMWIGHQVDAREMIEIGKRLGENEWKLNTVIGLDNTQHQGLPDPKHWKRTLIARGVETPVDTLTENARTVRKPRAKK